MYSHPQQGTQNTQTVPQPAPDPDCIPLHMVDTDGKIHYCYHGGKCRCEQCELIKKKQQEELDAMLEKFVPHSRLKLEPPIRLVKPKQYRLEATRVSPEMGMNLLKDHLRLREEVPLYYLPDKYYHKDAWKFPGPQSKATQTEILLGNWGIDGCPCPDKSECWDI